MDNIRKVLVGLDSSYMDKTLIPYTKYVTELFPVEKLYVVNFIKSVNLPDEVMSQFPDFMQNTINERKMSLEEDVKRQIDKEGLEIEYIV